MFTRLKARRALKLLNDPEVVEELKKYPATYQRFEQIRKLQKENDKKMNEVQTYATSTLFVAYIGNITYNWVGYGGRCEWKFPYEKMVVVQPVSKKEDKEKRKQFACFGIEEQDKLYKIITQNERIVPQVLSDGPSFEVRSIESLGKEIKPISEFFKMNGLADVVTNKQIELMEFVLNKPDVAKHMVESQKVKEKGAEKAQ